MDRIRYSLYILVGGLFSVLYAQTDPDYVAVVRSPVATAGVVTTIEVYRGDESLRVLFDKAVRVGSGTGNQRYQFMNNSPRIPDGATQDVDSEPARLTLPVTMTTAEKTGIYTVRVIESGGGNAKWRVLITNEDAAITFENSSAVVSKNERYTLNASTSVAEDQLRWRRDGRFGRIRSGCPDGSSSCDTTSTDFDVFECQEQGKYGQQVHAIMSVVVRDCPDGMWGPPPCNQVCQPCINGGICSNRTGSCLCPPGFSGDGCSEIHGRNVFGQKAEYRCNADGEDHDPGCQGAMICYPVPFGCICPAGYTGLNCTQECEDGWFGANCKQVCHCPDNIDCAKDTGVCENNQCKEGWQGINCQYCAVGYHGSECSERCSCSGGDCSEVQAACASGCFVPWTGLACDNNTEDGSISISYVRVNPGVVTILVCSVVRNPLVNSSDLVLVGVDASFFSTTDNGRGYTTTNTWSLTLDSQKTVTCSIAGTSQTESITIEPYDCAVGYYGTDCSERCSCSGGDCSEVQAACASGCLVPWTGLACDNNTGDGSISISSVRVNSGVVTTLVCSVVRNPLVDSSDLVLEGVDASFFNTTDNGRGYLTTNTWNFTLDSQKTVECAISETSQMKSITIEPYELLYYRNATPMSFSNVTPTSITVSWPMWEEGSDEGDGPILSYIIEYREVQEEGTKYSMVPKGLDLTHDFSELQSDTVYEFRIILTRPGEGGRGIPSSAQSQRTNCAESALVPGNVGLQVGSSTSLTFSWNPATCSALGDDITYMYELLQENTSIASNTTSDLSAVFGNLLPFTSYEFMVKAEGGPEDGQLVVMTLEDLPGPPNGTITNTTEDTLTLEWNAPDQPNGIITEYKTAVNCNGEATCTASQPSGQVFNNHGTFCVSKRISYRAVERPYNSSFVNESFSGPIDSEAADRTYQITELDPSTVYEVLLSAFTQVGGGEPFSITASTEIFEDLEAPALLASNDTTRNDSTVTLTLPPLTQMYATSYLVRVRVSASRQRRAADGYGSYQDDANHYIAAELEKSEEEQMFVLGDGGTYGNYYNAPLSDSLDYDVYVGTASSVSEDVRVVWSDPLPVVAIPASTTPAPSPGTATSSGTTKGSVPTTPATEGQPPVVAIAIAAVAAACLLLFPVLLVYCCCRRSQKAPEPLSHQKPARHSPVISQSGRTTGDDGPALIRSFPLSAPTPITATTPVDGVMNPSYEAAAALDTVRDRSIPVSELAEFIKRKKADPADNFVTEFESIPDEQLYPWTVASKEENKTKNRYGNILPYDLSRVVLQSVYGDPHSDYINASYIDGYKAPKKFIASHGPNKASVDDFWKMVWQEDVGKIVMLTALVENNKRKCKKYWPDRLEYFGEISVAQESLEEFPTYEVKTFHVTKFEETKVVRHFHFTAWRDMNVPAPGPLLAFLDLVRSEESHQRGPTVVHCSAGVGRTGTYITLDAMLDMAAAEQKVDIYDFVLQLRHKRFKSVQTEDQYEFIFDALLKALVIGETGIKLQTFRADLAKLKETNTVTGNTHLEDQFQKLENISELTNLLEHGRLPQNRDKNRFPNILPVESYRPILVTNVGDQGTDYINASFISGYHKKDMFLATQMPLKNTMLDLWRLVWDFNITKIVMLNDLGSEAEEYWSETGIATYGPFVIQFRSREFADDVCIRELEVCNSTLKYQNFQTVTHIQCLGWPNTSTVPPTPKLLLSTITQLNKVLDPNDPAAVLVQCMDGAGRSGMFCCLMSAMDQAKAEGAVDIFSIIQKMRLARPHMVENVMQYQCILDAFLVNLEDSQDYENLMI